MIVKFLLPVFLSLSVSLAATPAPDFTVTDSGGKAFSLYADFVNKGKVVVLEIFFINCPPCNTHAPHWQSLYDNVKTKYPGRVEFLMLSDKSADTNPLVAQYKTGKNLTMPGVGADGGSLAAVQPYKAGQFGPFYGTPTFIIITPGTGEVLYDVRGSGPSSTMDSIRQKIDLLLKLPECHIETPQGDTLKQYNLRLDIPGSNPVYHQVTDGIFSLENFPGLPSLPFFEMRPSKKDNPLNGVSTFDLVQINRQILGIELFQQPWQFIAGDANNSGTITTFDIVELRKLILGVYDSLPSAPAWVFSPAFDTINLFDCPEFLAIKTGDVNGNADPKGLTAGDDREGGPALACHFNDALLQAGDVYKLTFYPDAAVDLFGFQAAFRFDAEALEVLGLRAERLPGFDETSWRHTEGRLAASWFAAYPQGLEPGEELLTIELLARKRIQLSEAFALENHPLRPELYDAGLQTQRLTLNPQRGTATLTPNPASAFVQLYLEKTAPGESVVQLVNLAGAVQWEQPCTLVAGANRLEIRPTAVPAGLYAVRVGGQFVGKLVWTGR